MTSAVLGFLHNKLQPIHRCQLLLHPFGLVADDQDAALRRQVGCTGEDPFHQRCTGQGLQHLGQCALHASAFSGGQNGYGKHAERGDVGRNLPGSLLDDLISGRPLMSRPTKTHWADRNDVNSRPQGQIHRLATAQV